MIGEFLFDIVFNIATGFFELLPDFSWDVGTSAFEYFLTILKVAGYMFPWGTVVAIASLVVGLSIFRIVVAVIRSVWDLLPFV